MGLVSDMLHSVVYNDAVSNLMMNDAEKRKEWLSCKTVSDISKQSTGGPC